MKQVGNILDYYAYRHKYYAYGFGGVPEFMDDDEKGNGKISQDYMNCFPLTGDFKNPEIVGLDNLITTYRKKLDQIKLWGPTFFAPTLCKIYDFIEE